MSSFFEKFVMTVRGESRKKIGPRHVESRGQKRVFHGFDWGGDTFIFEENALKAPGGHQPILLVRKADLMKGASGYVMTLSTGNHAVAAVPLLRGQFWNLGRISRKRQETLMKAHVICANLVDGKIEISQRDVSTALLVEADEWLQGLGFPLDLLVMIERNPATLEHYRRLGQEWRVKPLAWTRQEMKLEIDKSGKRINSVLRYYHSAKGVHFLSYAEFHTLLAMIRSDYAGCIKALCELVQVSEGQPTSFMRTKKSGGHHEIELFGVWPKKAEDEWVPLLERLMQDITLGQVRTRKEVALLPRKDTKDEPVRQIRTRKEVAKYLKELDEKFETMLMRPQLADTGSEDFTVTLYRHLTGAIYESEPGSASLAFDDRRTALPGATYCGGRLAFHHPGVDRRTRELLSNLDPLKSQAEVFEYVNVYELRTREDVRLGEGVTREIEFKTNHRPLCTRWIEKRLKLPKPGYGSYLLARVHAFKEIGVDIGEYRLLAQEGNDAREDKYFLRTRCPGDSLDNIPERQYRLEGEGRQGEDPDVVLAMGGLLGDAAAQNLVVKKYIAEKDYTGCRFGEGKEIFEFAYELENGRAMPVRVRMCSVRGALGWPNLAHSKENLDRVFDFYLTRYAEVLVTFWGMFQHRKAVKFEALVKRFFDGFANKTREMYWSYSMRREQFDEFNPKVNARFNFKQQWSFALWALNRQQDRLDYLQSLFVKKANAARCAKGE